MIKRVKTQKQFDLHVPGGYEQFNYATADKVKLQLQRKVTAVKEKFRLALAEKFGTKVDEEKVKVLT